MTGCNGTLDIFVPIPKFEYAMETWMVASSWGHWVNDIVIFYAVAVRLMACRVTIFRVGLSHQTENKRHKIVFECRNTNINMKEHATTDWWPLTLVIPDRFQFDWMVVTIFITCCMYWYTVYYLPILTAVINGNLPLILI